MKQLLAFSLISILIIFNACTKKAENVSDQLELLQKHFDAASVGQISAADELKYVLKTVVQNPDQSKLQKAIKLTPAVEGIVSLVNGTMLSFKPTNPLASDQAYDVTIDLSQIDPSLGSDVINYKVTTIAQNMAIATKGYIINDDETYTYQTKVSTADKTTSEIMKSCFESAMVDVETKQIDPYTFDVNVNVKNKADNQAPTYTAKPLGLELSGALYDNNSQSTTSDPNALNVVSSHYDTETKAYTLYLASIIDKTQDLTGLVTVNGANANYEVKQNTLTIYLQDITSSEAAQLVIAPGLRTIDKVKNNNPYTVTINLTPSKPGAEFLDQGYYFASEGNFAIPIKTRNLKKLRVKVLEIPQTHVLQYITWQSFTYPDYYNLKFIGKPIYDEDVSLLSSKKDDDGWMVTTIDLSARVKKNPGSIYHIMLDYLPTYTDLSCAQALAKYEEKSRIADDIYFKRWDMPYRDYNYYQDYNWDKVEDPCDISYYVNRSAASRIFICSDYGIIAKHGANEYHVAVLNLIDLANVSGAEVQLYDLQGMPMANSKTDNQGFATFKNLPADALALSLTQNSKITYLKLNPDERLDLTSFDIQGERTDDESEYYLYTERGIWRPGEMIYLDVMVNKANLTNPDGVPIEVSFYNPDNLLLSKDIKPLNTANALIYHFPLSTSADAKTGRYKAIVTIGAQRLVKYLSVETIKPNIGTTTYTFNNSEAKNIYSKTLNGSLNSSFLTGSPQAGARVSANGRVSIKPNPFKNYMQFKFHTGSHDYESNVPLFSVVTNESGEAVIRAETDFQNYRGVVNLAIQTETTGRSGGAGIEGENLTIYPFTSFIGIKTSENSGWGGDFTKNDKVKFEVVNVNPRGNALTNRSNIAYKIQRASDTWWVDRYRYASNGRAQNEVTWQDSIANSVSITGTGSVSFGSFEPGKYRAIFTDMASGHEVEHQFYVEGYEYAEVGNANQFLNFKVNKESYNEGDNVELSIPTTTTCKMLISIERGNKVISQQWVDGDKGIVKQTIKATSDWYPNVYIHVSSILPYQEGLDLPIRTYGIKNIFVASTAKALNPQSNIPEKMEANQSYDITVSESNGQAMDYSFALVDEGLLNLTGFATPDPLAFFGGKFPLLVHTWDIYKDLIRPFKALFRGIAIGGDDAYNPDAIIDISKTKPVIIHQGVFKLGAGQKQKHTIKLPNYVGKLRLMIVACNATGGFGKLQKTVPVRNPIMVQAQLPNSLYVGDKAEIPVNITKDEASIKSAALSVSSRNGLFSNKSDKQNIALTNGNTVTQLFTLNAGNTAGAEVVTFDIKAGGKSMQEQKPIAINYTNSYTTKTTQKQVAPGSIMTLPIKIEGYPEAYNGNISIGGAKVPNFLKYANELITYPYGCLEQTTSSAFGQLYLDQLLDLSPKEQADRMAHLQYAVLRFKELQRPDGSFSYWESNYYDEWADLYAGNFLVELSQTNAVTGTEELLKRWLDQQMKLADGYAASGEGMRNYLLRCQAYRLFVLAKAGRTPKSALNRFLAAKGNKNALSSFLVAGAMKLSGFESKAQELIAQGETQLKTKEVINDYYYDYYSTTPRDKAIMVEVLSFINKTKMENYYDSMVDELNKSGYTSTHEKGYAFLATKRRFNTQLGANKELKFEVIVDGKSNQVLTSPFKAWKMSWNGKNAPKSIVIKNQGTSLLYTTTTDRIIPISKESPSKFENLSLDLVYYNETKGAVGLANANLGDDILITAMVTNPSALPQTNLALNVKMPGALVLINPRINGIASQPTGIDYQNYQDDKVCSFFSLGGGATVRVTYRAKVSYKGDYFVPSAKAEHMYRGDVYAQTASSRMTTL